MPRSFASMIFLLLILLVTPALAADRTVQKLNVPGKTPIEVWLTRADAEDGGMVIKVIAKGVGPRPQAITVYSGGGGDDGPGTDEVKGLTLKLMDVPAAGKLVRVDFDYTIPGTTETETQTTLIGFGGKTHKLLELMTKRTHQRNKNCKEVWETVLTGEGDDLDGEVVAQKRLKVIPVRGDDDEPLDQSCVPQKNERVVYRWNGEQFTEKKGTQVSPAPSPMPAAPKESSEED